MQARRGRGYGEIDKIAWHRGNTGGDGPQPVGQKQRNLFGLYDMLGNAWEWCADSRGTQETNASEAKHYGAASCARVVGSQGADGHPPPADSTPTRPPSYLLFSFFRFRFSLSVNFAFFCVSFLPLSFFPLSPIFHLLGHDVIRLWYWSRIYLSVSTASLASRRPVPVFSR